MPEKTSYLNLLTLFFAGLLSLPNTITKAQNRAAALHSLPEWVHEMNRPLIDYPKLKMLYNEFWSDKLDEDTITDFNFEEEYPRIKEQYGWLRFYTRQYKELVKLNRNKNPYYKDSHEKNKTNAMQYGQWTVAGPVKEQQYQGLNGVAMGVGRVNQLAFSGSNPAVMYAVAPGGLFITRDTANTWQSTGTDFIGFHQFRSVAVDPTNDSIIYIGCGDYFAAGIFDVGVLKSTDFGNTFIPLGNGMDSTIINVIQVNPANTAHIVAGGWLGIWTSFDSGNSWQHTFTLPNINMIQDIKFKPGSSDTLYATSNTAYYTSFDGGLTWNSGWSDFQFTDVNAAELLLGVTPAAREYVYICTQQDFGNIYKSTDGGITFTAMKRYQLPGLIGYNILLNSFGQGAYDFTFHADPFDSLHLYIGSISFYESIDGGTTWQTPYFYWNNYSLLHQLHCDQHFIARNPLLPDRIWVANDGGVYTRFDGDTMFYPRQNNLCVTQAYHFDADNFYDSTLAIGTQDNGAAFTNNGFDYFNYTGGDMFSRIYCVYNNNAAIYTAGPNNMPGASNINIHNGSTSYPFNLPESASSMAMSVTPVNPITAFLANTHLWETNDMDAVPVAWRKIYNNVSGYNFVAANHCLSDPNIFYAIRDDGWLFRSLNALQFQPAFDSVMLPPIAGWIPSLATVPNNSQVIYLSAASIYMSTDRGITWTDITGSMNALYGFQEIVADPFTTDGSVYVAATNKIYYRNDSTGWLDYSFGLPDVSYINDIAVKKFNSLERKVMATVLNRGIWQSPVYQNVVSGFESTMVTAENFIVYPVPSHEIIFIKSVSNAIQIDEVILYDSRGRKLSATNADIGKNSLVIQTGSLQSGIYFLELKSGNAAFVHRIALAK